MLRRQSNAVSPAPSPSASRKSSVVVSNVQRISQSSSVQSTAPNQALPKDQKNVCKFAGLLFPVYLAPFIFQGSPESLCLYSVLLPLCSWATGLMSSCAAGMTLMVTLPTLGLMSAEEAAQAFLGPSSLSVVILLVIVTAGYTGGSIIPRLSFKVCSKFGLRVRPLFLWLMALTYVMSLFLDKTVVTALLTLAVDSMLTCIYDCELGSKVMDDVDLSGEAPPPSLTPKQAAPPAVSPQAELLFAALAEAVGHLDEAESKK